MYLLFLVIIVINGKKSVLRVSLSSNGTKKYINFAMLQYSINKPTNCRVPAKPTCFINRKCATIPRQSASVIIIIIVYISPIWNCKYYNLQVLVTTEISYF